MKIRSNGLVSLDREIMTETERGLFKRDLMKVAGEYFETDGEADVDITKTPNGLSVCVLFKARRIKKIWSPQ